MPDWDDMKVFLAVARGGSLSAAGVALNLDPATAGRRVKRLEHALGTALFLKSPQGYALTEAGEQLLPHAEDADRAIALASDAMHGTDTGLTGTIRLGAPDGCANFLLPRVLAGILKGHPHLDVQVIALPRVFNLNRREADLAIGVSSPSGGRLSVQRIVDYQLVLASAPEYLRTAPPLHSLEDLSAHRLIGYIPEMIFDKELDYLDALGVDGVSVGSNSAAVQVQLARAGLGLAVVHDFSLGEQDGLQPVLLNAFSLRRSFYLIRHSDDAGAGRMARFAKLLVAGMRREMSNVRKSLTAMG